MGRERAEGGWAAASTDLAPLPLGFSSLVPAACPPSVWLHTRCVPRSPASPPVPSDPNSTTLWSWCLNSRPRCLAVLGRCPLEPPCLAHPRADSRLSPACLPFTWAPGARGGVPGVQVGDWGHLGPPFLTPSPDGSQGCLVWGRVEVRDRLPPPPCPRSALARPDATLPGAHLAASVSYP